MSRSGVVTNNDHELDADQQRDEENDSIVLSSDDVSRDSIDLDHSDGDGGVDENDEESEMQMNEDDRRAEEETPAEYSNVRRISLQRFTIYNSQTTMYIVGSNAKETLFRIVEISRDASDIDQLSIIEDKSYFYTRKDMVDLLNGLDESINGGIHKIAQGYGLIGLIRFTRGYYLSIITKCSKVAIIGGHYVYHIDETKLIPLDINYKRPEKYSDEERLLSIFKYLDLGKTFYFSYGYDITNTLQTNMIRNKNIAAKYANRTDVNQNEIFNTVDHNERFVWNNLLLKPVQNNADCATYEWFRPIIHGFIDQANISVYGKKFYITIIARRSHHFAGARFLKRGVNDKGNVANEIETEQIVSDMLVSSFHDPKYGFFNNTRFTSFVQHRGSIPLYWTQDLNKLPKPPIEINLSDPFYQSSAIHFNNLFERYGLPIFVLNLIKTKEKQPRELKLNLHFVNCITYLNQFLPEDNKLRYLGFDMSRHSKKNFDVIRPLQDFASNAISEIGFFHNGTDLKSTKLQVGIIRTNCIDCLDRTNAAQFIICKEALWHQLRSLLLIHGNKTLEYDSDVVNILTEIFHDHGDTIAIQYGGSNLVNTMDSYRRINQWSSHTRDILNSVKRMYSNSFMDLIRQEAINLFLGNYVYDPNKTKLWDLQNDFHLHNDTLISDLRMKISYIHWFNVHYLQRFYHIFGKNTENERSISKIHGKLEPYPEYNDNWFNECYGPRRFQSLNDVFQYTMNSTSRYFSSTTTEAEEYINYSPFESRKPKQETAFSDTSNLRLLGNTINQDEDDHKSGHNSAQRPETLVNSNRAVDESNLHAHLLEYLNEYEKAAYSGMDDKLFYFFKDDNKESLSFCNDLPNLKPGDKDKVCYERTISGVESSNSFPNFSMECLQHSTNMENDVYQYYTSNLLNNCSLQSSKKDLKFYSQYLGVEDESLFAINVEDDYFK